MPLYTHIVVGNPVFTKHSMHWTMRALCVAGWVGCLVVCMIVCIFFVWFFV